MYHRVHEANALVAYAGLGGDRAMHKGSDPLWYEIRVQGHLALHLAAWFDGLTATETAGGETVLIGPVADQSALHGYLGLVRDLGLPLLSVRVIGPSE